jgi:uncharacterized protein (TIGR00251 family)
MPESPSANPAVAASPDSSGAVRVRVKAVPGSSRTRIVGLLGDHLKVQIAAAPQDGKANEALCRLLAEALGVPLRQVVVIEGASRPRKIVGVTGLAPGVVAERLLGARSAS